MVWGLVILPFLAQEFNYLCNRHVILWDNYHVSLLQLLVQARGIPSASTLIVGDVSCLGCCCKSSKEDKTVLCSDVSQNAFHNLFVNCILHSSCDRNDCTALQRMAGRMPVRQVPQITSFLVKVGWPARLALKSAQTFPSHKAL